MLAVTVIGNIGNDAEIKEFNGQKFIAFNVASTERYKDRQGNQHSRTTWVSCLKPGEIRSNLFEERNAGICTR